MPRRIQVDAEKLKRKAERERKEKESLARQREREKRFEARFAPRPTASARARKVRERIAPITPVRRGPPGQRVRRTATPRAPARRGRPPGPPRETKGDIWTRLRALRDIRNRPPTPATTSPQNVLEAVGLVPTPGRRTATPTAVETSSGTTPAQAPEQITSPEDQALALGVSQELDLQPATKPRWKPPRRYTDIAYKKELNKKKLEKILKGRVTQPSTTLTKPYEKEAQRAFELFELGRLSQAAMVRRINRLQHVALRDVEAAQQRTPTPAPLPPPIDQSFVYTRRRKAKRYFPNRISTSPTLGERIIARRRLFAEAENPHMPTPDVSTEQLPPPDDDDR